MICGCNRNRNCCASFVENGCASKEDIIRLRKTIDRQDIDIKNDIAESQSNIAQLEINKQDKLIAGDNINIDNNEISADISEYVDLAKESYIIEEIKTEELYIENNKGKVFITHIPNKDSEGNLVQLKHGFANDDTSPTLETPTDFSYRKNATFVANASIFNHNSAHPALPENEIEGLYIQDGVVILDNRAQLPTSLIKNRYIMGIKPGNVLVSYKGDTSSNVILADGVIESLQAFIPILVDGEINRNNLISEGCTYWNDRNFTETSDTTPKYDKIYFTVNTSGEYDGHLHLNTFATGETYYEDSTSRYPRQVIAQKSNGDIYFIANNGYGSENNVGLTLYEFVAIAKYLGCNFAFVLDGGGSTASVFRNKMLNNPTDKSPSYQTKYDGLGQEIRPVPDFLYFSKEVKTKNDNNIDYLLAEIQKLNKKINDLSIETNQKFMSYGYVYSNDGQQFYLDKKSWDTNTKEFKSRARIYWDNYTSFPQGLSINTVNGDTTEPIIRIHNNKNDGIQYFRKKLGLMENEVQQFENGVNLNNLDKGFVVGRADTSQALNGAPWVAADGVDSFILFQFGYGAIKLQIAFSVTQNSKIKTRCYTTSWGQWNTILNIA